MNDPYVIALNSDRAARAWYGSLTQNMANMYKPGFREYKMDFSDFIDGVELQEGVRNTFQGKSWPGRSPNNLMVEGSGYFVLRKPDGKLVFTRLGDFDINAQGNLVNNSGYTVQGYLLGEDGKMIDTGNAGTGGGGANNPTHSAGGPGHLPTTEINLWVDPSNGKFFGKYDEYKVQGDGTVVGMANKGKINTPLYKIALVNFMNPGAMGEPEDQMFVPTEASGEPIQGSGEIRKGLVEYSNVDMRANVAMLQQAKMMMDVSSKIISTNKQLLSEALDLLK
jgi:flagellar hook protein FlgE